MHETGLQRLREIVGPLGVGVVGFSCWFFDAAISWIGYCRIVSIQEEWIKQARRCNYKKEGQRGGLEQC